jgi:hypothetical protein
VNAAHSLPIALAWREGEKEREREKESKRQTKEMRRKREETECQTHHTTQTHTTPHTHTHTHTHTTPHNTTHTHTHTLSLSLSLSLSLYRAFGTGKKLFEEGVRRVTTFFAWLRVEDGRNVGQQQQVLKAEALGRVGRRFAHGEVDHRTHGRVFMQTDSAHVHPQNTKTDTRLVDVLALRASAGKQTNKQTDKQANRQTSKQTNKTKVSVTDL